ncbi:phenylalanine--tRNA ligase beta subunit-related protein [Microgenomates group bacterium]|nr:phenylalanine--tRNA ligase beta subunit-related protein [Microgenomates group bacterium]
MNILIVNSWLREYLKTTANMEEIKEKLSLCGPSVERVEEVEGEEVLDIEITTNRVDSMSVRGLAREAAVILNQFGFKSKLVDEASEIKGKLKLAVNEREKMELPKITDGVGEEVLRRIICAVVEVKPEVATSEKMARRLRQVGENVHTAVVDITNYVTYELGHPCHAFDYDKVMELGGEIIVAQAEAGKKFTTLDGEEHLTVGGEIVFLNPKGEIIDLPAIKGTANTAVDEKTKRVLFWLENLSPEKVRFGSMSQAIRTLAAVINEKNVDPFLAEETFYRGLELLISDCEGKLVSEIYDYFPYGEDWRAAEIKVEWGLFGRYLGIELEKKEILKILGDLKLECSDKGKELLVKVPSYRADLNIPVDIVEEVARIYGYHNLPSKVDYAVNPTMKQPEFDFALENAMKNYLTGLKYWEIYQYSMVSEELAAQGSLPIKRQLKLRNELTSDHVYMRTSLIPSLTEVWIQNITKQGKQELSIYEMAQVYIPKAQVDKIQSYKLGMVSNKPYREWRADLEELLGRFFIKNVELKSLAEEEIPEKARLNLDGLSQMAVITAENARGEEKKVVGYLYEMGEVLAAELEMGAIVELAGTFPVYQPLSPYSAIIEDLTFKLGKNEGGVGRIMERIEKLSELIGRVELKDIYEQNYTWTISYLSREKQLETAEIAPIRKEIVEMMERELGAELVGKL